MSVSYTHFLEFIVEKRWKSKSQISQDLFVYYFTNHKKDGFFIEIGACNGVHLSNTFMLEKIGWSGIICEPSKFWHDKIKQLQKKLKTGKKTKTLSEQEIWDIEDEINELKGEN